ncbi:MAG: response regulator [Chryseosolibacter sp.]
MLPNRKRILIVEDDDDMLFLLEQALTGAGYVVESCKAGTGIVESKHTWPDLFILDKNLPTIDGLALSKFLRLQEHTRHVPIVMISAYPLKHRADKAGIDHFIQKPFDLNHLLDVIAQCCEMKSGEPQVV